MPPTTNLQAKTVTSADGTTIFAQAAGSPSSPALVCVHGFLCTSFAFSKLFADTRLLDKVYVIAYDVRGSGRSGTPIDGESYHGKRYAEDFKAVCEAFGVVKPVILGW
jgi:pimeloyl-ACP methyl ester carboxylesterase